MNHNDYPVAQDGTTQNATEAAVPDPFVGIRALKQSEFKQEQLRMSVIINTRAIDQSDLKAHPARLGHSLFATSSMSNLEEYMMQLRGSKGYMGSSFV